MLISSISLLTFVVCYARAAPRILHSPLPTAWHHEPNHPVHALFRRAPGDGVTYPPVGTPGPLSLLFFFPYIQLIMSAQNGHRHSPLQVVPLTLPTSLKIGSQLSTPPSMPAKFPTSLNPSKRCIPRESTQTAQRSAPRPQSVGFQVIFGMLPKVFLQVHSTMGLFK